MEPQYSMAGRDSQSLKWSVAWDKVPIEHWACRTQRLLHLSSEVVITTVIKNEEGDGHLGQDWRVCRKKMTSQTFKRLNSPFEAWPENKRPSKIALRKLFCFVARGRYK